MRIYISCETADVLVIAEPFAIEGSSESFGVHRAFGEKSEWEHWTATHAETGFRVAGGDTLDEAVDMARRTWTSKKPEQIVSTLGKVREICAARRAVLTREVVQ
jgi:hypothetical protein